MVRVVLVVLLAALAWGVAPAGAEDAAEAVGEAGPAPDADALVRRAEDALRGATTIRAVRMSVIRSRGATPRVIAFYSWDDRRHRRSFIRVLSPSKHAGTTWLHLPPNVWSYVPHTGRTSRVAPEALLRPWLESDFTLDDWLDVSGVVDDYEHAWLRTEEDADGRAGVRAHVVESRPRDGASPAWGRLETWIEVGTGRPLRRDYFDGDGERVRTLRFHGFRQRDGRDFPERWVMTPAGAPGRETRIAFESVAFDREIDEAVFTTRNLKAPATE